MKNKVLILGSTGLVGSNLYKKYREKYPDSDLLTPKRYTLDLEDRSQVIGYFIKNKPFFHLAVKQSLTLFKRVCFSLDNILSLFLFLSG